MEKGGEANGTQKHACKIISPFLGHTVVPHHPFPASSLLSVTPFTGKITTQQPPLIHVKYTICYYTCPQKPKAGSNLHKGYLLDMSMKNIFEQHR